MYVVVGYGNVLRRDDGAGLILAQHIADFLKLKGMDVLHISVQQLAPELIYDCVGADGVIFVDTCVIKADPVVCVDPIFTQHLSVAVGHQMAPEMLLLLLEKLLDISLPAWMVRVPGWDFGFGEGISSQTQQALTHFAEKLERDWQAIFLAESLFQTDTTRRAY